MILTEVIAAAQQRIDQSPGEPVSIMVAGGSATGKSSQVMPELARAFGGRLLLVSQDWYQLGDGFPGKDSSPYRWDDPNNFQLDRLAGDIRRLRAGETVASPSFDLHAMESVATNELVPSDILVVDGIYSLLPPIKELADFGIYTQMPFYARFIRRLFRTVYDLGINKPETVFKHAFGSVLRAHQDFVRWQTEAADCVIDVPYSFADTIKRYSLTPTAGVPGSAERLWGNDDLAFGVIDGSEEFRFLIEHEGAVFYNFAVSSAHRRLVDGIDYSAV